MNKKTTKTNVFAMCAFALSFAGCSKAAKEDITPSITQIPTELSAQVTAGASGEAIQAPANAPTTAPTQAVAEQSEREIADILVDLQTAGVIAAEPENVTVAAVAAGGQVEIESVETFDNSFIAVTLSAKFDNVDTSDIALRKYTDDWYSLSADASDMTVTDSYVTVNDEGETVIIYSVADIIEGTKAVTDTSTRHFFNLKLEKKKADNYLSWQMDNGGWDKEVESQQVRAWDGIEKKNKFSSWTSPSGEMVGTIDNEATYTQMRQIAAVYREVPDEKYKESVIKGLEFIFKLQEESGAFAQCYPRRGGYSDAATFNDNAMINVLIMLEDMRDRRYPFDSDIIPEEYVPRLEAAIAKGIDFILKAQIVSDGKLTAWCAQHDPVTYEPVGARAYELPSISGSESVGIVKFLMNQEQTPEIKASVEAAIQWFKDSEVKDTKYVSNPADGEYFIESMGSSLWYRFYEIDTNLPIFCDRDGVKKHDIAEIGEERRNGYSWSGTYPKKLLEVYDTYGYYAGRIEAVVVKTDSVTAEGKTLAQGSIQAAEAEIPVVD